MGPTQGNVDTSMPVVDDESAKRMTFRLACPQPEFGGSSGPGLVSSKTAGAVQMRMVGKDKAEESIRDSTRP